MFDISAFAQGLALGLGMFVCPGPKDLLIVRHALLRHPAVDLIAIGTLSDALLIFLGMAGATAALSRAPAWQTAALGLGVVLLIVHGLLAAWRAASGRVQMPGLSDCDQRMARSKGLLAVVMVSFLNPLAWLDTLLVIGSVGVTLPPAAQTSFALGATTASLTWFTVLVTAARRVGPWMARPGPWRALEAGVAALMLGLALYLASAVVRATYNSSHASDAGSSAVRTKNSTSKKLALICGGRRKQQAAAQGDREPARWRIHKCGASSQ